MGIPSLPEEIIAEILSYLETEFVTDEDSFEDEMLKRNTLVNACLVSRSFYNIGRPLCYRTIDFKTVGESFPWAGHGRIFAVFSRSLRSQIPVQRLRMALNLSNTPGALDPDHIIGPEAVQRLKVATQHIPFSTNFPTRLLDLNLPGVCRTFVASLCPNLTYLDFELSECEVEFEVLLALASEVKNCETRNDDMELPPLQNLQELVLRMPSRSKSFVLDGVLGLLALPSLKKFMGIGLCCIGGANFRLQASHLERIDIYSSFVTPAGLAGLLQMSPRLSHLTITFDTSDRLLSCPNVESIGNVLRRHGRSLRTMALRTEKSNTLHGLGRPATVLGSLRELDCLAALSIPLHTLTGNPPGVVGTTIPAPHEMLPFSLQHLYIYGASDIEECHFDVWVDQLLSDERYQNLRVVSLESACPTELIQKAEAGGWAVSKQAHNREDLELRKLE